MPLSLQGQRHPLAIVAEQQAILRPGGRLRPFEDAIQGSGLAPLRALGITTFQMNLGKLCNQTCKHCHVDAGPDRTEVMTRETMEACLRALAATDIPTVDLTGGAPELNPHFRWLVEQVRSLGRHVMDRCNLTVLRLKSAHELAEFLARHHVEIVASLPYFLAKNTDAQRGEGVFQASIEALRQLNELGYGQEGSGLVLNLVYNPTGAFLPPRQATVEPDFRRELLKRHGIVFNHLYVITNMPINRFLEFLLRTEQYDAYMKRLIDAYNPAAAAGVMCRTTLSVGWDGRLYDCDFNQMLELPLAPGQPQHIADFDPVRLADRAITTAMHCYGCTAGAGSSCTGAVVS
ncbi:MAG TPA: arsenosugar biosynthesis radical SAM (seleno)protein ArsS [Isosphaeraceae bacterium]|jgi:radical SAM/Cys-rich protein|nr:arsenosugar biosynthesis radical SAM (seleno)protein ArsS [Isosphaeraceae bacterium]